MTNLTHSHKRSLVLGGVLTALCFFCVTLTAIFIYSNSRADKRVEEIRKDYREAANRRDKKVEGLSIQVLALQQKLNVLPDQTADKTADKVKQVVAEDDKK